MNIRARGTGVISASMSLLLSAGLVLPALAGTEVYIGVAGAKGETPWGIGMPPFSPERQSAAAAELARQLHEVVRDDLAFSRRFKPLDSPSAEAASDPKARAEEWRKTGAGFVLSAKVAETGSRISVTASLLDLSSGDAILERYYRQDSKFWRSLAHQIADDIVRQITGKPGLSRTRIVFSNDESGSKELYIVDYDGTGLRRVTNDHSISLLPRWAPDGRKILYTGYRHSNPDIFEIDLERGSNRAFLNHQGLNLAGGFSPDGSQLVLTQSRQKNPNVYLMNLSDRSIKAVTNHFGADTSPTFSPDGKQVAFVSDRSGNPQVHILNLTSGKTQRLTRLNWCDSPSWSPTGEWIAFSGRANVKDRMDIFIVDVTGNQIRQLTHGEGSNEDPSWSRDGRFLVFTSTRNKRRQLFVMDADGSAPRLVGDIPGNSFTPDWSR